MSLEDILIGGLSASFATLFTNPIDAMKIRMQMKGIVQNKEGSYSTFYRYNVRRQMYLVTKGSKCVALQVQNSVIISSENMVRSLI